MLRADQLINITCILLTRTEFGNVSVQLSALMKGPHAIRQTRDKLESIDHKFQVLCHLKRPYLALLKCHIPSYFKLSTWYLIRIHVKYFRGTFDCSVNGSVDLAVGPLLPFFCNTSAYCPLPTDPHASREALYPLLLLTKIGI